MNLKASQGTAVLAPPIVALEYSIPQSRISGSIQSYAPWLGSDRRHEFVPVVCSRNARFWAPGKNLNTRSTDCSSISGSSFSRFAPARKSAQIISRQ